MNEEMKEGGGGGAPGEGRERLRRYRITVQNNS